MCMLCSTVLYSITFKKYCVVQWFNVLLLIFEEGEYRIVTLFKLNLTKLQLGAPINIVIDAFCILLRSSIQYILLCTSYTQIYTNTANSISI